MKTVLHLERKFTAPTETFIVNQVNAIEGYNIVVGTIANLRNLPTHRDVITPGRIDAVTRTALYLRRSTAKNLRHAIAMNNPFVSCIHTHYLVDALFFLPLTKEYGVPKICSAYGYDVSSFPNRLMGLARLPLKKVFRSYDYFLAMSHDMKKDFIRLGCPEEKIIVHYYGTDARRFANPDRSYGVGGKPVRLLSVGTVEEKKAQHLVIDALHLCMTKHGVANFEYHIVGSGPYLPVVKKKIIEAGLSDRVMLHGFVPYLDDALVQHFSTADIFTLPSITLDDYDKEGIPGTIIEAMASGLPVVSTTHAGIPDVITNETDGLLVRERDVDALAVALTRLIVDESLRERLGRNAARRAFEQLDLQQRTRNLERIYSDVLGGIRPR